MIDFALLPDPNTDDEEVKTKVKKWRAKLEKRIARQQETTTAMQRAYQESLLAKSKTSKRDIRTFHIGDKVMLRRHAIVRNMGDDKPKDTQADSSKRTHDDKRKTPKEGIVHKRLSRFVGPYEIIDRIGTTTYKIRHCADVRDIRTYSIDDLKTYYPRTIVAPNIPKDRLPVTGEDHGFNDIDDDEYEVERILNVRNWEHGGGLDKEYLIRYKDFGREHDQWVLEGDIDAPQLLDEFNVALKQKQREGRLYIETRSGRKRRDINNILFKKVRVNDTISITTV